MLIVWFFAYKKLAQFAVRCALPPRRSESPVCKTDNKPSCVLHLLGWFIGSCGFSSLERRPEFWVLQYDEMELSGECNFFNSISSQQKFEVTDIKPSGASQLSDSPCYSSQTDLFYLENKGMPTQTTWRRDGKTKRERGNEHAWDRDLWPFGSSFYVFSSPWACPMQTGLARSAVGSTWGPNSRPRNLPLFCFPGLSPCLSFSHCHSGLLSPVLTTWQNYIRAHSLPSKREELEPWLPHL